MYSLGAGFSRQPTAQAPRPGARHPKFYKGVDAGFDVLNRPALQPRQPYFPPGGFQLQPIPTIPQVPMTSGTFLHGAEADTPMKKILFLAAIGAMGWIGWKIVKSFDGVSKSFNARSAGRTSPRARPLPR